MEVKKGISVQDMHTFANLRDAALRTERLIEEESSMVMEEQNMGKNLGKRKGNFSSSTGASKGRNLGSKGGYPSMGDSNTRQTPSALRPRCSNCGKRHKGECWYLKQEQTVTQKLQCPHCDRRHEGECRFLIGACFGCGELGYQCRQYLY